MVACPACHESGKMTVQVSEMMQEGVRRSSLEMKCVTCNGVGKVEPRVVADLERERSMWCDCAAPGDPEYFRDGAHAEIWKHHWRCRTCGGILQIG